MALKQTRRIRYVARAAGTIAVGIIVHRGGLPLGAAARDVAGDALWAVMVVWWVSAFAPEARLGARAALALTICLLVEFSQLYSAPALDALRSTAAGHLVLGSGFDPRDLVAYAAGVLAAVLMDAALSSRATSQSSGSSSR